MAKRRDSNGVIPKEMRAEAVHVDDQEFAEAVYAWRNILHDPSRSRI